MLITITLILQFVCTCDCGLWIIPYRACSLQFSFIGQALTSVSAVFWFLLSEIQCRLDFQHETKFYIGRALSVTDNEVEILILSKREVFYGSIELKGTGPFSVPSLSYIERLFKYFQKENVFKQLVRLQ